MLIDESGRSVAWLLWQFWERISASQLFDRWKGWDLSCELIWNNLHFLKECHGNRFVPDNVGKSLWVNILLFWGGSNTFAKKSVIRRINEALASRSKLDYCVSSCTPDVRSKLSIRIKWIIKPCRIQCIEQWQGRQGHSSPWIKVIVRWLPWQYQNRRGGGIHAGDTPYIM